VVVLKDVYGLSCLEIGEHLGVSEGAVKVRLHRARRRLRALLMGGAADEV
jgi:RNA polymerase sigma-70 factor (ECF subfamily)